MKDTRVIPSWAKRAACAGSGLNFFSRDIPDILECFATCIQCPVIDECRDWGADEVYGVWGGTFHHPDKRLHVKLNFYLQLFDIPIKQINTKER